MVFADLIFLYLFLPANLILYYMTRSRSVRNTVLVAFSIFFYAWGEPVCVVLLFISSAVDYTCGLVIDRNRGRMRAKLAVAASLVANLGLLGVFKYSGMFVETLNGLFGLALPVPAFALPIGISFYTFQTISYTIDVYREDTATQYSFGKFLLFVSLYHQLVAGPIVRYRDIAAEIDSREESAEEVAAGIGRFCTGLAKKTLVANTAGRLAGVYLDGDFTALSVGGAWFGILLFALQIYYDFSGYSDMAIGLGRMFGFHYRENFNYPYVARSASEFWRRWHISLGSFFRDYLYIPMGGNRRHVVRNLLVVWFATGLWHGASWNFVAWGLYWGALIVLERALAARLRLRLPRALSHLYLITAALFGWVLFYFTDLAHAVVYMGRMLGFGGGPLTDLPLRLDVVNHIFWLLLSAAFCMPVVPWLKWLKQRLPQGKQTILEWMAPVFHLIVLLLSTAMLVGQSYNPFLYFRF